MAYRELNSLRLKEEYCNKPKDKNCPIHKTCYDDEFQCQYWKQVFINPTKKGTKQWKIDLSLEFLDIPQRK